MFIRAWRVLGFLYVVILGGCGQEDESTHVVPCFQNETAESISPGRHPLRGALVSTRFTSFESFKTVASVEYFGEGGSDRAHVTHCSNGLMVKSILESGVSERDFIAARDGGAKERLSLLFKSPYAVINRKDLQRAYVLSRRRPNAIIAFYDISKSIMNNIYVKDTALLDKVDLTSEKGYFNTINHVTAQAFITSLFSEKLADFIADAHERKNMPELVSGDFTIEQIEDIENGPVDNYVDMINNEWGQELGKRLREKYRINRNTLWSPGLLTEYLNDLQRYYSWAFQVDFEPFRPSDYIVKKFSWKVNKVMKGT